MLGSGQKAWPRQPTSEDPSPIRYAFKTYFVLGLRDRRLNKLLPRFHCQTAELINRPNKEALEQ